MKTLFIFTLLLLTTLIGFGQKKISEYPNIVTPNTNNMLVLAATNVVPHTNYNWKVKDMLAFVKANNTNIPSLIVTNLTVVSNFTFQTTIITNLGNINPTIGYVPYNFDGTNFADSPWYRIATNQMGFNGTNFFLSVVSRSIGFGEFDLFQESGASDNTAFGFSVMTNFLDNSYNSGFGSLALVTNNGSGNSAFGALTLSGGGQNNSAFGVFAFKSLASGQNIENTGMGAFSGQNTLTGSSNSFFGAYSGWSNVLGNNLTLIGHNANSAGTNDSYEIVIGADAVGNGSFTTTIGTSSTTQAVIYASGYAGGGTKFLSDDGTYKSSGATTINSLDGFVPVRGSATAFTNSNFRVVATNVTWLTNMGSIVELDLATSTQLLSLGINLGGEAFIQSASPVSITSGLNNSFTFGNGTNQIYFLGSQFYPAFSNLITVGSSTSPFKEIYVGYTNSIIFAGTNPPPVSAVAPTKWISVQVNGDSAVYRMPLYE